MNDLAQQRIAPATIRKTIEVHAPGGTRLRGYSRRAWRLGGRSTASPGHTRRTW